MNGTARQYEVSRSWVIYHVMEHDLHHGGEVSLILGMNGLRTPRYLIDDENETCRGIHNLYRLSIWANTACTLSLRQVLKWL